jgi:hypothetical protein
MAVGMALDTALDAALTQLQFPSLVASFIFLAFARSSAAECFLAPGSPVGFILNRSYETSEMKPY